ncbi:MAG TPA: hypothetical protein VF236_06465 [Gaiellaceae bacterium]
MKRFLPFLAALLVIAPAAFAQNGGEGKSPAQFCKNELATLGAANFKSLYAPNGPAASAFGKCVSKHASADAANRTNAAKACRAEMEMPEAEFRATHDGKSFAEFYGKNRNARNAFGMCVSSKAQAANAKQEATLMKAAKTCKAERAANRTAFTARYGGKAASAFGKCVSSKKKRQ